MGSKKNDNIIQGRKNFNHNQKKSYQNRYFGCVPCSLRQRNIFLFERLTIHRSTPTASLTTHPQL